MLEDGVDVALVRRDPRDVLALEPDDARGRRFEAGDHPQRRGLAAARRAEHREELAARDAEVGVVHRDELPEPLRDVLEPDDVVRRRHHLPRRRAVAAPVSRGRTFARGPTPDARKSS